MVLNASAQNGEIESIPGQDGIDNYEIMEDTIIRNLD